MAVGDTVELSRTSPLATHIWSLKTRALWRQIDYTCVCIGMWDLLPGYILIVFQDRWSLIAEVSYDRFYCTVILNLTLVTDTAILVRAILA